MANLVSPGVQVTVTDESVYGPAGAGTVPMLRAAASAATAGCRGRGFPRTRQVPLESLSPDCDVDPGRL